MARKRRVPGKDIAHSRSAVAPLSSLIGSKEEDQLPVVQETGRPVTAYTRQGIGYDTRKWLWEHREEIKTEVMYLLKHAKPEDTNRVNLAKALLNKLVADANDGKNTGAEGTTFNIQFNGLQGRGTFRDGQRIQVEQAAQPEPIEGELEE